MRKRCAFRTRCNHPRPPRQVPTPPLSTSVPLAPTKRLQHGAASPTRAFITTCDPTIQVCPPPHNLRCQTTPLPYTGHSNNKDAEINPSAMKKRKLSEAISS
ncbi:unnamed protein product, partial [Iphiclides podalirius]